MRFSNIVERVLGQRSKVRLIKALYKARMPLSGRHLAKICKLNHRTCLLSLKDLEKEGIIRSRSVGKSLLFEINKSNYFVRSALSKLFEAEDRLLDSALQKLLKKAKGKPGFASLILYGSIVKGEETPDSDIDLAVVLRKSEDRKKAAKFFEKINPLFTSMFGNVLSPYFISKRDFQKRFRMNQPLIREIARTGKVIFGIGPEELVSGG
jgi:predicted nucleotidyltransferase